MSYPFRCQKRGNKAKIIDLISWSYNLKQGEKDILTYSNELRAIHAELDHCYPQSSDPTAVGPEGVGIIG